jgi:predicted CopG family antitoxin
MNLKTIAISRGNYEALRNFGKTGMSFNDVISELIKKAHNTENSSSSDNFEKIRSEQRPTNHTQTVSSPVNSER